MSEAANDTRAGRLAAHDMLRILDTPPEREFDIIVEVAKRTLGTSVALVSIVDADRLWFKAQSGMSVSEAPLKPSFCRMAIEADAPFVLPDTWLDPRFSSSPFVLKARFVRFYAGVPVRAMVEIGKPARVPIGSLCVIDSEPRQISPEGLATLLDLALLVEALLDAKAVARHAAVLAERSESAAERLRREHRRFAQAERLANMGSWRLTLDDQRTEWSDGLFAIHELPVGDQPPLETALDFYPPQDREIVAAAVERTIETGKPYEIETDFVTASGNRRRVRSIGELEVAKGLPVALVGVFQDITERHGMEQTLRHLARTDDLTQIPNRARFNQVLDDEIERARAAGDRLALLLIDLDGFKSVNDRCGHPAGDELLRQIGRRLQAPYLAGCFAARLGGDEFVVVVSRPADCEAIDDIVERLLGDLRQLVCHDGGALMVSGSIGISWLADDVPTRSCLMQRADAALYAAKRTQRGTARTFRPDVPMLTARLGPDAAGRPAGEAPSLAPEDARIFALRS